jgi:hypothetical protein
VPGIPKINGGKSAHRQRMLARFASARHGQRGFAGLTSAATVLAFEIQRQYFEKV